MNLPQEFLARMEALLGDEFSDFLRSYEEPRRFGLRVNTLKLSAEEFRRIAPFHLKPIPWTDNGFYYEKEDAPARHPFYYAGLYYLQEPSAMAPAQVLPVTPGDRVLDLCAAPGGKATALAAKLQGKGLLVANDISASRAKALLKNLEVSGVVNSFVTNAAPARLAEQFPEAFDKILVDAPCSGEGMFRKDIANANAWSLTKVYDCAKRQKEILVHAVSMLRPGGMLLYSTCTFSPEEDEQVIAYLLKRFPELELVPIPLAEGFCAGRPELAREDWQLGASAGKELSKNRWAGNDEAACEDTLTDCTDLASLSRCVRIFPHRADGEGHFLALLRKREADAAVRGSLSATENGALEECTQSRAKAETLGKRRRADRPGLYGSRSLRESSASGRKRGAKAAQAGKTLPGETEPLYQFMSGIVFPGSMDAGSPATLLQSIALYGSQAYYVASPTGVRGGIPFLRNGLYLGELKKNRFEPSQALAMALWSGGYEAVLDLDWQDERVRRYLCGETIENVQANMHKPGAHASANGWWLVCVNGYPLGWGKLSGTVLKNKYHSGWRMQ